MRERFRLIGSPADDHRDDFADAVREGLSAEPREVPARFLYDDKGSELFERICELPEYYPTRAEREILVDRAAEIVAHFDAQPTLVEFGSGSAEKTRAIIEALLAREDHLRYAPIDISRAALEDSADTLLDDYPDLEIVGVWGEYERGLEVLEREDGGPLLVLWLGSNIGNLEPDDALSFLTAVRRRLDPGDRLLVGVDLVKDAATLEAAYDDAEGVTAAFTLNLIERIGRELGGDLDPADFRYHSFWNAEKSRIEAYLECVRDHTARIAGANLEVRFHAGERIHTEYAYKYTPERFAELATRAGLRVVERWTDRAERFQSALLAPDER